MLASTDAELQVQSLTVGINSHGNRGQPRRLALISPQVYEKVKGLIVCSNRAATRVENIRTQQKTAPLRYLEFGLYKQNLEEARKQEKRLCCLHTAEAAGSIPASPTLMKRRFAGKTWKARAGPGAIVRQPCSNAEFVAGVRSLFIRSTPRVAR
jgi:hypothetical protein